MLTWAAKSKAQAQVSAPSRTASGGPRRYFCTYFDSRYASRGLALYRSLERHVSDFELWILCFDRLAYDTLLALNLSQVRLVSVDEFERGDLGLLEAKPTRSVVEYFFTCTPSWLLYLLNHNSYIDVLVYVDADLFFFSSPEPLYEELGCGSLLITAHNFPGDLKRYEQYGRFNVGLMVFRNDEIAVSALSWWRERCLEWCFDRVEETRFADQKYLDAWPELFPGVHILSSPGGALAPWNWMNHSIRRNKRRLTVDGDVLITYHFQSVSLYFGHLYVTSLSGFRRMPARLRRHIYGPYVRELASCDRLVQHTADAGKWLPPTRARQPLKLKGLLQSWRRGDAGASVRRWE